MQALIARIVLLLAAVNLTAAEPAPSPLHGRYVRFELPDGGYLHLSEVQVFSGGENLAARGKASISRNVRSPGIALDGITDGRTNYFHSAENDPNPAWEVDLGNEHPIDSVVLWNRMGPGMESRLNGVVASILYGNRRVVWYKRFMQAAVRTMTIIPDKPDGCFLNKPVPSVDSVWYDVYAFAEQAPAAANAETQAARFSKRNFPPEIEKLSCELFALIKPNAPGLEAARDQFREGRHAQALDAFRNYYLAKLIRSDWFWPIFKLHPIETKFSVSPKPAADALLQNIASFDKRKVNLGAPGRVNWTFEQPFYKSSPGVNLLDEEIFAPLLNAFTETGDPRYLKAWADYIDDQLLNWRRSDPRSPVDLGYNCDSWSVRRGMNVLYGVTLAAKAHPDKNASVPADTLARVLLQLLKNYSVQETRFSRADPQNHQCDHIRHLMGAGIFLSEFQRGEWLLDEARRAIEEYYTQITFPDGTELQRDPWYNGMWLDLAAGPVRTFLNTKEAAHETGSFSNEWREWLDETLLRRGAWYTRALTANGEFPVGARGYHSNRAAGAFDALLRFYPPALQDPDLAAILTRRFPDRKTWTDPRFLSDAFAYGGWHYMRDGWKPEDAYGFFYSAAYPTDGFRINANNYFGLYAFGRTLLDPGDTAPYSMIPSPVRVDGKEQSGNVGIVHFGHKRMAVANERPNPFRWHGSPHFDVVEGEYGGTWGGAQWGPPENVAKGVREALRGVKHNRVVTHLREAGLWIVADRLTSEQPHRYTLDWRLPLDNDGTLSNKSAPLFRGNQIHLDKQTNIVKTDAHGEGNLSLYMVGSSHLVPLEMASEPPGNLGGFQRVSAGFEGKGAQMVLTAAYPRCSEHVDLVAFKPLHLENGVTGFETTTANGASVRYLAAEQIEQLNLAPVSIKGESLVLVGGTNGSMRGIAMGCSQIQVGGALAAPGASDFEFSVNNGQLVDAIPIYRPIEPVKIGPETNVFTESLDVKFTCPTPGVDIRYTLDGSDPTPASSLVSGVVRLQDTAVLKGRAFRPGLREVPLTQSCTHASSVARAVFTKTAPLPPKAASASGFKPGLDYTYFEGYWTDLFGSLETLQPRKSGEGSSLFDIGPRQSEGPFAFIYKGYLELPKAGVYTFHAPREYHMLDIDAGYELIVLIDGIKWRLNHRQHGTGAWSVALEKGLHSFEVRYADVRGASGMVKFADKLVEVRFDRTGRLKGKARSNFPDLPLADFVWSGITPVLEISGPEIDKQPIPTSWLFRSSR